MKNRDALSYTKLVASVLLELALGALAGVFAGIGMGVLLGVLFKIQNTEFGDLVGALAGFALGFGLFAPIGVYLTGRYLFKYRSSLGMTYLGGVCGALGVIALAEPLQLNTNSSLLFSLFVSVPLILAVICFNARRTSVTKK